MVARAVKEGAPGRHHGGRLWGGLLRLCRVPLRTQASEITEANSVRLTESCEQATSRAPDPECQLRERGADRPPKGERGQAGNRVGPLRIPIHLFAKVISESGLLPLEFDSLAQCPPKRPNMGAWQQDRGGGCVPSDSPSPAETATNAPPLRTGGGAAAGRDGGRPRASCGCLGDRRKGAVRTHGARAHTLTPFHTLELPEGQLARPPHGGDGNQGSESGSPLPKATNPLQGATPCPESLGPWPLSWSPWPWLQTFQALE